MFLLKLFNELFKLCVRSGHIIEIFTSDKSPLAMTEDKSRCRYSRIRRQSSILDLFLFPAFHFFLKFK